MLPNSGIAISRGTFQSGKKQVISHGKVHHTDSQEEGHSEKPNSRSSSRRSRFQQTTWSWVPRIYLSLPLLSYVTFIPSWSTPSNNPRFFSRFTPRSTTICSSFSSGIAWVKDCLPANSGYASQQGEGNGTIENDHVVMAHRQTERLWSRSIAHNGGEKSVVRKRVGFGLFLVFPPSDDSSSTLHEWNIAVSVSFRHTEPFRSSL